MEHMIKPSVRFSVSPDAIFQRLHGEMVILDMTSDAYFGLNSSGAFIWESLSNGATIEETAMKLANRYPVEINRARRDTISLATELAARGLIVPVEK